MRKSLLAIFLATAFSTFAAEPAPPATPFSAAPGGVILAPDGAAALTAITTPIYVEEAAVLTPFSAPAPTPTPAPAPEPAISALEPAPVAAAPATVEPPAPRPVRDISLLEPSDRGFSLEGFSFGAGAGLFGGVNFNVGYRIPWSANQFWLNRIGFRLDFNTFSPVASTIRRFPNNWINDWIDDNRDYATGSIMISEDDGIFVEDLRFNTTFTGTNFGALLDFYPFSYTWGLGGIRLTAGYYFGRLNVGLNAEAQGITAYWPNDIRTNLGVGDLSFDLDIMGTTTPVTLSDVRVNAPVSPVGSDIVTMSDLRAHPMVRLNARGPYLGIGWDMGLFLGLRLTFDAGVVITQPHRLSIDMDIASPELGSVLIDIEGVGSQLFVQLSDAARNEANVQFTANCTALGSCSDLDRNMFVDTAMAAAMPSITAERDAAMLSLHNRIMDQLDEIGMTPPTHGLNIVVDGNDALRAIGADSVIRDSIGDVYAERDRAIADFDREVRNWGYFPMARIGLIFRF